MEYTGLGKCGLKVSRLCLGTMTFGDQADEAESVRMVKMALDAGITFYDTANSYNAGEAERILGKALAGKRDDVVVATKAFNPTGPGPNDRGLSARHLVRALDDSLRRLGMDHVDLYQLHQPDYTTPLAETLGAMDALVRAGKVRYVGTSNYASWQICQAMWICDKRNWAPVVSAQPMYNLLSRGIEPELLRCCREFGLGVMVYNPLAGGLLTGKHRKGAAPAAGTRFALKEMYRGRYWHERLFDAVEQLRAVADGAGISLIELSLRWLQAQPDVTCIILGASSTKQLSENLSACEGELTEDALKRCDEVWDDLRGPIPQYNR
jgi:aryl-alcohol dehydrogenase-like predicted oxidoreductase